MRPDDQRPDLPEPSLLDYLKSKLRLGRGEPLDIPAPAKENQTEAPQLSSLWTSPTWPWRSLLALLLALIAQRTFEPPPGSPWPGLLLYLLAFGTLAWAYQRGEWRLAPLPQGQQHTDTFTVRRNASILSVAFGVMAFLTFGGNLFTSFNLTLWVLALIFFIWAFWLEPPTLTSVWGRLRAFFGRQSWSLKFSRWTLLILAVAGVVIFFRFYHIGAVPAEPFSDHAEKLLDVYDVSQGQTHIFFPRNTGREAIQMYWTLLMSWIFGTGISFISLKIGTVLLGLFTIPFIYLLGKELGNRRVGLLAMLLFGIGYWPNLTSRIGLRFPLYPLFVAPMLYFLIRGLRTQQRNDFILSGLFLGLGLHGYSPYRIVPIVVVIAFALYLLHAQSKGSRRQAILWLFILALASLMIFLPLFRYALEHPDIFSSRAISRITGVEQPLTGPWWQVFASNIWNGLKMFNWDDGNIWVNSVPHRPALGVVSGALFLIGVVLLVVRYLRQRHWLDLFLLASIPLLQLPSTLSLAFPDENPALNRAGGAAVPVFLIVALALDGLITSLRQSPDALTKGNGTGHRWRVVTVWALTGVLLLWSTSQNYSLVFDQFNQEFRLGTWNSSEMGQVIKFFGQVYGETDTVWVVPYPYWVDTRLPGVWAGIPNRDFAMWPQNLPETLQAQGPKLFIVKPEDQATVDELRQLYPPGVLSRYTSATPNHDFLIYFVPPPS